MKVFHRSCPKQKTVVEESFENFDETSASFQPNVFSYVVYKNFPDSPSISIRTVTAFVVYCLNLFKSYSIFFIIDLSWFPPLTNT